MLQEERLDSIFQYIKQKKFVTVEELSQKLEVSPMTIRRDLNNLCDQGRVERCHGGAQLPQNLIQEMAFDIKKGQNQPEKQKIAQKAMNMIKDYDTIYLDSGTTTFELAKLLCRCEKKVSVMTNDLNIAMILSDSEVELTIVGGNIQKSTKSIFGRASEQFLKEYRFSKIFLGGSSIDEQFNLFSPTYDKAYTKRVVLDIANRSYLLVDSSKFHKQSLCMVGNLSQFSGVITDKQFTEEEQEKIRELNIDIINTEE